MSFYVECHRFLGFGVGCHREKLLTYNATRLEIKFSGCSTSRATLRLALVSSQRRESFGTCERRLCSKKIARKRRNWLSPLVLLPGSSYHFSEGRHIVVRPSGSTVRPRRRFSRASQNHISSSVANRQPIVARQISPSGTLGEKFFTMAF